jgi:O-antigen ligase
MEHEEDIMSKKKKAKAVPAKKKSIDNTSTTQTSLDKYIQFGLLLLVFLLPLVVRLKMDVFISPFISIGTISTGMHASFYSYYKWVILLSITVVLLGLFIIKMLKGYRLRSSYINLPLAVLAGIILWSTLWADYKMVSLVGYYDQHMGALTYLAGLLLLFIAANTEFTERFGRLLTLALGTATVLMAVISMINYVGIDLTQYNAVRNLLAGSQYAEYAQGFFASTLGNQNHSSGLAAALLCYFGALLIWGKKQISPLLTVLFAVSAVVLLLTSLSSSGIAAAFIGLVGLVVMAGFDMGWRRIIIFCSAAAIAGVIFIFGLAQLNPQLIAEISFWKQYLPDQPSVEENVGDNPRNLLEQKDWLAVGSGRGYIWVNTLDLIKNKPLVGHGANTMAFYFPYMNTPAGDTFAIRNQVVDKPHSIYLGIAFDFGFIALALVLYLIMAYLFRSVRQVIRFPASSWTHKAYYTAILGFLIAYWIQGLFNDFVIGSAPLLWILMGCGVSIYYAQNETGQASDIG